MGKYPIQLGNWLLIVVGLALVASGPYIIYRTIGEIRRRLEKGETISLTGWGSYCLNLLIGTVFFFAGILFVVNNLRGNPLA